MEKKRHHKKNQNWKNNQNNQNNQKKNEQKKKFQFNSETYDRANAEDDKKKLEAIQELKSSENICPICGQNITDIASAIVDKSTKKPAHFECVLKKIEESETEGQNEKIAYIGQGRFGLLYYENPRDQRKFVIKKIIDYEDKEEDVEWRSKISDLYSKVN